MKNYKLLTPGPLTTTDTVKGEMMFDHCTWDDDYKQITQEIRKELLKLAHVSRVHGSADAGKRNLWCGICSHKCDRKRGQASDRGKRRIRRTNGRYCGARRNGLCDL